MYPHLSYGHEHAHDYDFAKGKLLRMLRGVLMWQPDFHFQYEADLFRKGKGENLFLRVAGDESLERTHGIEGRLMRLAYGARDHIACLEVPSHPLELGILCLDPRSRKAILDTIFDRRLLELMKAETNSRIQERIRGLFESYYDMLNS